MVSIELLVHRPHPRSWVRPIFQILWCQLGVAGTEYAAGHGYQVGQESYAQRVTGQSPQLLSDFWQVPVTTQRVGHHVFIDFRIMSGQAQAAACTGYARFTVDNDVILDQIVFDGRSHAQNGAGGVTAGVGNQSGLFYGFPVQFREAKHCFFQVGWIRMVYPVPLSVLVGLL